MSSKAVESLSFEQALGELQTIVRSLETGEAPLDESITAYERGALLKNHCEKKLKEARAKIEKVVLQSDGSITTQPLDQED